jgi:hypothetical protein
MIAALPLLLALLSPPDAPLLRSAPAGPPTAPPTDPPEWVDLADTTTTGEPEFIETDSADAGLPETPVNEGDEGDDTPKLPAPPSAPLGRFRRPQAPSNDPPPALARDLDPVITPRGCLGWAEATQTAACVEGQRTSQGGGRAVLTLLGQTDEPYLLWTHQTAAEGDRTVPSDPIELEAARARLAALAITPLPAPQVLMTGPGREHLGEDTPVWLVWKRTRVGSTANAEGPVDVNRHAVGLTCGARRARLFELAAPGGTQQVRVFTVGRPEARFAVIDFTRTWVLNHERGDLTRAVVVDLDRLCRRRP